MSLSELFFSSTNASWGHYNGDKNGESEAK